MAIGQKHEIHERRRGRNMGVMFALVGLIGLIFAVTIVKLGPNAANPSTNTSWGERLIEWVSE